VKINKIILSESQLEIAHEIAYQRATHSVKQGFKYHHSRDSSLDARIEKDFTGTKGELAFSSLSGLPWDNRFATKASEISHGDFTDTKSGVIYEIKSTKYRRGQLQIRKKYKKYTDFAYVLAIVGDKEVWFPGWRYGHEVITPKYWRTRGDGGYPPIWEDCWSIPQGDLTPLFDINLEILNVPQH